VANKHVLAYPIKTKRQRYLRGRGYLEFLEISFRVVDQGKASGLAAAKLGTESKRLDRLFGDFVHGGEARAYVILGQIGFCGVEDVNHLTNVSGGFSVGGVYKLFAVQETVCLEFAGAESCTVVGLGQGLVWCAGVVGG
jgi:hypothetical protein